MLKQRGDTLIEVLFAFSVFSLVAVGALTIMNEGSNVSERGLEINLVRSQLNAQAETLRFLHDSYTSSYQPGETFDPNATDKTPSWQWQAMEANVVSVSATSATDLGSASTSCPTPPSGSFIVDSQAGTYVAQGDMAFTAATGYAQVQYDNGPKPQGIWIEGIRSDANNKQGQENLGYIDFHILACWPGVGTTIPMTLGTIVRLYEPR